MAYINGTKYFYSKPELVLDVAVKGLVNIFDACKTYNIKEIYDNNIQLKADKINFDILTKNVSINMNENSEKVKIIYK